VERHQIMILSIGRAYDESSSAYFPANCGHFVHAEQVMQQEIMICKSRIHAENFREMVLPIRGAYEQYCSVYFPVSFRFFVNPERHWSWKV
jgi:hypothetical protein